MKKFNIFSFSFIIVAVVAFTGCYKLQTNYDYQPSTLDPHINMSAKDFLHLRGINGVGSDTVFKWMQMGIEYAGIDSSEYEKSNRTYIFLHNNAIRATSGSGATFKVTGGFFFDYPIIIKDANGNVIKSKLDPTADSSRPAMYWTDYPQQLVKNYFLYLILDGDITFGNLSVTNTTIQTLLPAGTVASAKDSKLGQVITKTTPNPDPASAANITFSSTGGTGFDPEGKMNLKLVNNQNAPIEINDRTDDRSAGYFATNGKIHVYDKTVHPFRYSWQ